MRTLCFGRTSSEQTLHSCSRVTRRASGKGTAKSMRARSPWPRCNMPGSVHLPQRWSRCARNLERALLTATSRRVVLRSDPTSPVPQVEQAGSDRHVRAIRAAAAMDDDGNAEGGARAGPVFTAEQVPLC